MFDQKTYEREIWYPKNKTRRLELNNAWRNRQRAEFQEIKKTLKCKICPEDDSCCLEFHHLDPTKKELNVATAAGRWSTKRLLEEISKCIVLCSNCHKKVHAEKIMLG